MATYNQNPEEMYRRELAQQQEIDEKARSGATVITEEIKDPVDNEKNSSVAGSIHWAPGNEEHNARTESIGITSDRNSCEISLAWLCCPVYNACLYCAHSSRIEDFKWQSERTMAW
jgi:hypothetical protein